MRTLALFATLLAVCFASQSFRCSFTMRSPQMTNGGYVVGTMKYDFATNKQFLNTYTSSNSLELFRYNGAAGYGTAAKPYDAQFEFSWGGGCDCSTAALTEPMPILFSNPTYLSCANGVCTSINSASPMASVTFDGAGYPVTYTRKDGKVFSYTNCVDASFTASADFSTPSDCSCGKPINVVLVLDRSSSIDKTEFGLEKEFTKNLVAGFSYSPTGVNLGITNFHTLSWDGPINLAQGNVDSSVMAGANALQCAPDSQCHVFSSAGSCCGMGTSISSGIITGAEMLQKSVTSSGFRATAANVMIVLTDGYHNRILKKDASGNLIRDNDGKVSGEPYVVNGKTCSEGGEQACVAGLEADLRYAVKYAVDRVPRLQILAVGVGEVWKQSQLEIIANGIKTNVFGTNEWGKLNSLVDDLISMTCQGGAAAPCSGCCGFCACSGCTGVDGCDAGNFCDTVSKVGSCCNAVPKPPGSCDQVSKCNTYTCDRTLKNGAGDCKATPKPLPDTTDCAKYECNPTTGETVFTDLCPPQPACKVDTDCDDKLPCTVDKCVIPNPADPLSAFCETKAKTCTGTKCHSSACNPTTGACDKTPLPIPDDTTCTKYKCEDATGIVSEPTGLCTTEPLCTTNQDCDDKNACNVDKCVLGVATEPRTAKCVYEAAPPCTTTNKCESVRCVPETGCTPTPIPIPPKTTCNEYSCDPATGIVISNTGLCTPEPVCTVANQATACNDNDKCTDDVCELAVQTEPRTAKCVNKPSPPCDTSDKCFTTKCVPADGCVSTAVPIPDNTVCYTYSCVAADGIKSAETGKCTDVPVCTPATVATDCNDKNLCTDDTCVLETPTEPKTAKCVFTTKAPDACNEDDKCFTYSCDVAKGCVKEPVPVPANTVCSTFICDPKTGIVETPTGACTVLPVCTPNTQSADCDDGNACTDDICTLATPSEPRTAKCESKPQAPSVCDKGDKCKIYSCDPAQGCLVTDAPIPPTDACTIFGCDAATGITQTPTGDCSATVLCTPDNQAVDCDDNNLCTDDTCVLSDSTQPLTAKCFYTPKADNFCNDPTDLCQTYFCEPSKGCTSALVPVPLDTECTAYECIKATGEIETTDLCPPQPQCRVAADCDDNNVCTTDQCILSNPADELSASCVWEDIPPCDDKNACTNDYCDVTQGCLFEPVHEDFCNDNDACTVDSCDPNSLTPETPCVYEPLVCNGTDNACQNTTCHTFSGCMTVDIVCESDDDDNCTIAYCNANSSGRGRRKKLGCYTEKAGDCDSAIGAIVGGLVAGVIAGIVIAAIAGALLLGGGAAYAFSQGSAAGLGATVSNNPLYEAGGESGVNPLNVA